MRRQEVGDYFSPDFRFHGPGGFESDYAGLSEYFESVRAAFDDRSIRRGIVVVEGNNIACQTWIEGTFVREFTQSPVGPLPPNGKRDRPRAAHRLTRANLVGADMAGADLLHADLTHADLADADLEGALNSPRVSGASEGTARQERGLKHR